MATTIATALSMPRTMSCGAKTTAPKMDITLGWPALAEQQVARSRLMRQCPNRRRLYGLFWAQPLDAGELCRHASRDHPNLLTVVLGDGSGRSISKDTELTILENFVTRRGGEVTQVEDL
jgi:hypothetical protein